MGGQMNVRLFISIPMPAAVKTALQSVQEELRDGMPQRARPAIRWTNPEQFHLTLRFLGDVDSQLVPNLIQALRNICQPHPPLDLRAEEVGFFPARRPPRVVWIGVRDRGELLPKLQQKIEAAVGHFSALAADKEFKSHLTIGRIKSIRPAESQILATLARKQAGRIFGEWSADSIHLMRSELLPEGARHTCVGEARLEAPRRDDE